MLIHLLLIPRYGGNVINPDAPYKVVIEGHADEIAWYVNYINDEGMVYVLEMVGQITNSTF
jgi:putative aminopeptidase FrvX